MEEVNLFPAHALSSVITFHQDKFCRLFRPCDTRKVREVLSDASLKVQREMWDKENIFSLRKTNVRLRLSDTVRTVRARFDVPTWHTYRSSQAICRKPLGFPAASSPGGWRCWLSAVPILVAGGKAKVSGTRFHSLLPFYSFTERRPEIHSAVWPWLRGLHSFSKSISTEEMNECQDLKRLLLILLGWLHEWW